MARTLSQDLRDRVVAAIDSGLSCRAAAARFGVSVSSAIRWRRQALEHGQAVAKPRGGDRHSGKIEAHGGFIRELIAEQGDMTLVEVQARLIERGAPVGIGTVLCSTLLSWFRSVTMIELAAVPPVVVQAIGSSREALTSEVMPIA